MISSYFTSSDFQRRTQRETMRFYDDIAYCTAFAAPFYLGAPSSWGVNSFFKFSEFAASNWGVYHEVNHANDKPRKWGFSKQSHG